MCVWEEYEDELPEYIACVNSEVVAQTRHRHKATQLTSHRLPTLGCQRVAVLHSHVLQTTCCLKTDEPGRPRGLVTTSTDQPDKPYGPVSMLVTLVTYFVNLIGLVEYTRVAEDSYKPPA